MDPIQAIAEHIRLQSGFRMDASQSLFFSRQLEQIKARTFEVKYPELKFDMAIPIDTSADPGVEVITYRQFDEYGEAIMTGNNAQDARPSGVKAKEFSNKVYGFETFYEYTTQDIRRAQYTNTDLEMKQASAAKRAMRRAFDYFAFFGNAQVGAKGLLNHASVPLVTLPNTGPFAGLSAQQKLDNLNALVSSIPEATQSIHHPDTLLLDTATFEDLSQTNVGLDNQKSVLRSFLENNPYIKNIDQCTRCNNAGATASFHRILCYKRDPEILQLPLPLDFSPLAPQAQGTKWTITAEGRIGVLNVHYPKAIAHADIAVS